MVVATAPPVAVESPPDLEEVLRLYQQGLCLQAHAAAQPFGPLRSWKGAAARVLAGRLALNLGAPKLAFCLHSLAWRSEPDNPEARYFYARTLFERRGPLPVWQFLRRTGDLPEARAEVRADWFAFHAYVLGRLRDFEAAQAWLTRAEQICPDRPWVCLERSYLLEMEDRYAEALQAAQRSLEIRAWYRPGVQSVAHVLQLLNRDQDALDLLREADRRIENGPLVLQLAALQTDLRLYADAGRSYARFAELSPLLEKGMREWLAARRSDIAYYIGDDDAAVELARQVQSPLYDKLAEKLAARPRPGKRVLLDVGFVRQHHHTCVPATLATVSRFWHMPADHLEVAAAICYDGTPDHRERRWVEEHGWVAREFTVTWDSAVDLIDRGIPFTLTTTEPANAHMQAVIGYDGCRESILIRDPFVRQLVECVAQPMLDRYRSTGPRGMVLVPRARAELLDGLALPDAEMYDRLHLLQRALEEHERDRAACFYQELQHADANHRLTHTARRLLAIYDTDRAELLAAVEKLLELFPDDQLLQLSKLGCLRDLARRDERLKLFQEICVKPETDPIFWRQYAQELAVDARAQPLALHMLKKSFRRAPFDVGNFALLANIRRDQRRFDEALELDRFATCLEDKDEALAQSYFWTARYLRQTEQALIFLRRRFERFGKSSSQPARTLYWAFDLCERTSEAFAVLEDGLKLRPADGQLLLFAAEAYSDRGKYDRASSLLVAAEGNCPETARLRSAAHVAEVRGDKDAALALWRKVASADPLCLPAHRAIALLLAETEGRAVALDHLQHACERYPFNYPLHQLWIEWLREQGPRALEPVVRRFLANHPDDAWARRELALTLSDLRRHDEAVAELEIARHLEPDSAVYFGVQGQVFEHAGRRDEARQAYHDCIRRSVDNDFAISRLIGTCEGMAERRAVLDFVEEELLRQTIFGEGLLSFQHHAQYTLEPIELLESLQKALAARPDLWHAWSAVVRQLIEMNRLDEAHELARKASAQFPLQPRIWLDLALACRGRQDRDGQVSALEQALQINPNWGMATRELADVHQKDGKLEEAQRLLEQAVARAALDPSNHGYLADILWQRGQKEAAFDRLQKALLLDPGYGWAWRMLRVWAGELGCPEKAVRFARDLTARRAGEARSWLMLAEGLTREQDTAERLAALDRAIELNPRCTEAYDHKAEVLAQQQRFDEALAACRPESLREPVPLILRGRAAWIEAQRGNLPTAAEQMRAVVAEDPNYYWGWSNLADWHRQDGDASAYLEAAGMMARLSPQNPVGFGMRGEARLRAQDRAGAKEDLRHALELAPDYTFAGLLLFDLEAEDGDWEAAAAALKTIQPHAADDEYVLARSAWIAARQDDPGPVLETLRKLCVAKNPDTWPLQTATAALVENGWARQVKEVLESALEREDVHQHVGEIWVQRCLAAGRKPPRRRLETLLTRGEVGRLAVITWAKHLADHERPWAMRRVLNRYRDRLRDDTRCWGMVGYCYVTVERNREAVEWLADWPRREGVEAWMLINLVLALRGLGRDDEANAVSREAVKLPEDYTLRFHHVWLALDEALAGDAAAAAERLRPFDPAQYDSSHRFLHALVQAVIEIQQAKPADRPRLLRQARRNLKATAAACSPLKTDRPALRHAYRLCIRRLAHDCGTLSARLWSQWRQLVPLLPSRQVEQAS